MNKSTSDLLGLTRASVSGATFHALDLGPPVPFGSFAAVFAPEPQMDLASRSALVLQAMDRTPHFLPLARNALSLQEMPSALLRHEQLIKREMVRLSGRRELVVTLSFPVPPSGHAAEGSGIRWLKQRSDHLRVVSSIRRQAVELLQTISDALDGASDSQCLSPFGSSRVARIGADLALLIPAEMVPYLVEELRSVVPSMLPRNENLRYEIQGPLPPYSFAASLQAQEVDAGELRSAS